MHGYSTSSATARHELQPEGHGRHVPFARYWNCDDTLDESLHWPPTAADNNTRDTKLLSRVPNRLTVESYMVIYASNSYTYYYT